jgi:TfoX N-terminal domain
MEIPKPAEADKSRFTALVPADPRVEIQPMFGNLGAFVNGNMFMGVFGPSIGMKLPETDCATLRLRGATPFGPVERPMGGYVSLPTTTNVVEARMWVAKALDFVDYMPAKKAKPKKS